MAEASQKRPFANIDRALMQKFQTHLYLIEAYSFIQNCMTNLLHLFIKKLNFICNN